MHDPQNKKQSRSVKRVKSGCRTCKIRRVKCDESRPACRRCVSTGRACDGYGIWGGGGNPYGQPQSNRALSVYCTPVPSGSMTVDEQMYFNWFMEKTTKKFAGLFASDFWETLVLQASAQEPAVRHAVVALSAAHRFDRSDSPWAIPATYGFDAEQFTLQQYNKAIHFLRSTTGSTNPYTLRVALITCLVFVTLEFLRGQYKMGSAHLRYGIKLLSNISSPHPRSLMSPSILSPAEDFAHNALIDSYSRLTVQSALFGQVPSNLCIITRDPKENAIPYTFSDVLDARRTLDDLLNRVHCLKRYYYDVYSEESQDEPSMFETQKRILADLSLWRKSFNASLPLLDSGESISQKFRATLLSVYHEMATIMASVCLSDDEMIFDSYTENFIAILKGFTDLWNLWASVSVAVKEVKDIFSTPESDLDCHEFTVESGFIPPVYFTALKCRIPQIRRQAVRILKAAPHREGVWNGALLAQVLDEVIRIEEDGIESKEASIDVPLFPFVPSAKDFPPPNINGSSRLSDVAVILPDRVKEDTVLSYKKLQAGNWSYYKHTIKPNREKDTESYFQLFRN
ncbi:uncharacterized protein N7483_005616 [Penicillium malachiteum]|uniref:uncharacterized protein n=1 Tax=Penicillium malachiteum TaxID=1324776 RepID=UPI002547F913|nr:uncharacterized protein N7483_005616 [Penicillium malachiteum]KAJ5731108.1 hypothetical protein N7483_005616 [Penicillium malachiteum]